MDIQCKCENKQQKKADFFSSDPDCPSSQTYNALGGKNKQTNHPLKQIQISKNVYVKKKLYIYIMYIYIKMKDNIKTI